MNANMITTKELARLLHMSVASINYYTNLGLFNISDKKGNVRLYDKAETVST